MSKMKEELLSVGIDIGTSTTQLVFSKLIIENLASSFSVPRISIVGKEIIYKSDIYFTPLLSPIKIDGEGVRGIVENEYKKAGVEKAQIDTGAVIITGETARKENAGEVLAELSGFAGDFVVATAGADLESIISGKGAGADKYSEKLASTVVNIDIGGGTSNLAVFADGETVDTGCMDIGGRLIKIDADTKKITYITPKIREIIQRNSLGICEGDTADERRLKSVIDIMVRALEQSVGILPKDDVYNILQTHKSIGTDKKITHISFSGGVADYIYSDNTENDIFKYGDIGVLLGKAIRKSKLCSEFELLKSRETIRATVVGAGTHTTEISGSTITYTKNVFPIKNMPVLKLSVDDEKNLKNALIKKLEWYKSEDGFDKAAIAFKGHKNPTFAELEYYADEIADGVREIADRELPIVVIVEYDMAKALGQALYKRFGYRKDIICLDGIKLDNGDYIDMGKPIAEGAVLPVVIKTLVFN